MLSSTFALTISYYASKYKIMMSALCLIQTWFQYILRLKYFKKLPNLHEYLTLKHYCFDRLHIFKISMYWKNVLYLNELHNYLQNHRRHGPFVFVFNLNGAHFLPICHCHICMLVPKVLIKNPCDGLFLCNIIWDLGQSINYALSKSAIFDPLPPTCCLFY